MRLVHYINESNIKLEEFYEENKEFLEYCIKSNKILFRGLSKPIKDIEKKTIRKERRPTDTNIQFHEILDKGFNAVYGKKLRSESLFCTLEEDIAEEYGSVHIVIPIGQYKIYWSINISDIFVDLSDESLLHKNICKAIRYNDMSMLNILYLLFDDQFIDKLKKSILPEYYIYDDEKVKYWEYIERKIKDLKIPDRDIYEYINLNYGYYKNNKIKDIYDDILNKIDKKDSVENFIKNNYTYTDDIKKLSNTSSELMLVCDEYYIFSKEVLRKLYKIRK